MNYVLFLISLNYRNSELFPKDFFQVLPFKQNTPLKTNKEEEKREGILKRISSKKIYIDLEKEYEEEKELIDILEGKRKIFF